MRELGENVYPDLDGSLRWSDGAYADNQLWLDQTGLWLNDDSALMTLLDDAAELLYGATSYFNHILFDRRQRGLEIGGFGNVVKSNHRQIVRHAADQACGRLGAHLPPFDRCR